VILALVTPLLEKNPSKTVVFSRCYVPLVLSMARVIVLLFALAMLRQVVTAGLAVRERRHSRVFRNSGGPFFIAGIN
jgi:hypothetical protein